MKNEDMEKLARAAAYQDGQIAERDTHIAELKAFLSDAGEVDAVKTAHIAELEERLWTYDNALKMTMDEKCSGDQEHCGCVPVLKGRVAELQSRLHLIVDLGFDYDGFESADDLKTLIDDIVKIARGKETTDDK